MPRHRRDRAVLATANRFASYGCGTAALEDGLAAALMSETFHRNGIATERVLAVIALPDGFAIIVRAARNLLRPSHFFAPLKQGNRRWLRGVADYCARPAGRERRAGPCSPPQPCALSPDGGDGGQRASVARPPTFEREYVFCWLDWDGDNVLADGGIIDYGSVRQFGLYHREYRFDDGPRWSTTIPEQRRKARADRADASPRARDFLITGRRAPLDAFAEDPVLRVFDRSFATWRDRLLLRNAGFPPKSVEILLASRARPGAALRPRARLLRAGAVGSRARWRSPDGLTWDAISRTRDLLRELPRHYREAAEPVPLATFLRLGLSSYAQGRDRRETGERRAHALAFQRAWLGLMRAAARRTSRSFPEVLQEIDRRSARINRFARLTGDGAVWAARKLLRARRRLPSHRFHEVIERFLDDQILVPEYRAPLRSAPPPAPDLRRVLLKLLAIVAENRHGL